MTKSKRLGKTALMLASCLSMAACGADWIYKDPLAFLSGPDNDQSDKIVATQTPVASLATPPGLGQVPVQNPTVPMNKAMQNGRGLNLETYLAYDIEDPSERVKRLEQVVLMMNRELESLKAEKMMAKQPAPQKSVGMQPIMDPSIGSQAATNAPQSLVNAPVAPPAAADQRAISEGARPIPAGPPSVINGIRVGEHPDKVRIVFDVTKNTSFGADLDNNENILLVELPNAKWETPAKFESFGKMPLLKSYKVDSFNNGQGNIFVMQLKGPTQIIAQGKYPALSGNGERIVIDLKK